MAQTPAPLVLGPDGGRMITGGAVHARLLIPLDHPTYASTFEMQVAPGFDVGAHVHGDAEEMFYVVQGQVDVLCFEPVQRSEDWHAWESSTGQTYLRGGPGAFMYVPPGAPHAFANTTDEPARMFFQSSVRGGHENYFAELAEITGASQGHPRPEDITALMARYDTEQITSMKAG